MLHHTSLQEKNPFPCLQKGPPFPLHQLLESMQCFLGDPEPGCLKLEIHHLAMAIAKKILKSRFKNAQRTTDQLAPNFQTRDRVYVKNKQPRKWDLKWRAGCRIVHIEHDGHCFHIENQTTGKNRYVM